MCLRIKPYLLRYIIYNLLNKNTTPLYIIQFFSAAAMVEIIKMNAYLNAPRKNVPQKQETLLLLGMEDVMHDHFLFLANIYLKYFMKLFHNSN